MASFCKCGSLIIDESCTNKKCKYCTKKSNLITPQQIEHINDLKCRLEEDYEEDCEDIEIIENMTAKEASELIKRLKERLI